VGHGIEEAPDIRVKHPVHLLPENAGVEGVQRIVLAAPRPESVGIVRSLRAFLKHAD
jgi:hypothetical protein